MIANHPAEHALKSYSLGTLDDTDTSAVEQHITECEQCRRVVEEAPPDSLVGLLRASIARQESDAAAHTASVMTPEPASTASTLDSHPPLYKRVAQLLGEGSATASAKPQTATPPPGLADHARYQVFEHLGSGGMGTVFKAQHRLMNRAVAIKVINPALLNKPSVKERFMREVTAAAKLAHAHIVTAYDAEQSDDLHLLVMEFVEGETLADRIRREGALPVPVACQFMREAALGLQHAHEKGMVHRDIKPANLMIVKTHGPQPEGLVKVLDFGLACFRSENHSLEGITELGALMGTPDYMAPEQALDPHTADIRADIYSLGCTLYHALAGQVPYPATTPLAKIDAHRAGRATPLKSIRPDVPAELSAIVEKMMAKDPAKRFQTPAEVAEALLPFTQSQTAAAPVRRRRFPLVAAIVLLALAPLCYFFGPTVFRFVTNQGVLIIETDDKDIKITAWQDKDAVEILDVRTGKTFVLKAGSYKVQVTEGKPGLTLETSEFALSRGGKQVVKVTWDAQKHLAALEKNSPRLGPPAVETAESLHKLVHEALGKQDYATAAQAAERLVFLKPDSPLGYYGRAHTLLQQGKRAESIPDWTKVLSFDPNDRDSLVQRSFAYLNTDQFDLCIADCDRLLKLETKGHLAMVALLNRGGAWALKGRFEKGYADFDAAFKLGPNDTALLWKGIILKRMGEEAKGQAEIDKGLKLAPHMKDYGFNRLDHVVPQPPPLDEWLQGREVLTVSQDGKAKFKTIGAALDALKPGQVVKVLDKGPYKETLDRNLPENVGLISEVGTRIELDKWNRGAAAPWGPKKFFYHNHVLRCPRNLRVSGFDIVGNRAEDDAGLSIVFHTIADGDVVVEGCRVFFTEAERQTPPKPGDPNLPFGRVDFGSWSNQPGQIWIRNNYFGRHVIVNRPGTSIVMERNHIVDPHNEAFHIWTGVEPPREFIARHNVLEAVLGIKIDGTKAPTDQWLKTPVSIVNNLFEVTRYPVWFSAGDEEKKGWDPRNVRIQNNIIRAADRSGVMLSAKGMSEVRDAWRVSHNCYPYEPGGTGNMQTFSRGPTDKIEPKPYLSDDPKHTDYLRISPKSPLATGGAGGDLPLYIGPHAPGRTEDKKAFDSLQGDWTLVSRETNGWKPSDETSKNYRLTIKGDQWILNPGPSGTITIDTSKDPMWFDVSNYSLGIYKLEGDTLTICRLSKAWTTERPKDFKATKDDRNVVLVYKRLRTPVASPVTANSVPVRTFGTGDPSTIFDVAFSPSGKMLAAGGVDGRVKVWDTTSEKLLKTFEVPNRMCYSLAFSPDEKTLITGSGRDLRSRESKSGELRVWDLSTGKFETLDFFADPVTAVAFSPDGKLFASVAPRVDNKTKNSSTEIKIWDAKTKTVKQTLKGHPRIWSLAFSPDGKLLASGGLPGGGGVKLWDIEKGEEMSSINLGTTLGYSVVFSPKPGVLAICSGMGSSDRKSDTAVVVLWDYHAKKEIKRFGDFSGNSYRPAFSKQGDLLACGTGSRLRLFDMNKHEEIAVIPAAWQVRAVAFSPDDRSLAAVWSDGVVAMWSVSDLRALRPKTPSPVPANSPPVRTFGTGDPSIVYTVAFSPSGKMLAVGGGFSPTESGVRLWDTASEKLLKSLHIPNRLLYSLAFSPDEKTLITGSGNSFRSREAKSGELRVWDLASGQYETLDFFADPVSAVAYSADGKLFASIATRVDNQTKNPFTEIKIWDAKTKTVKQTLQGHASAIWSLAFSPDGKLLAYGSGNGIKLWDIDKGQEATTINLGLPVAYSVAFSPKPGVMAICGGKTRSPDRKEDTGLFVLFDYHANKQIMRSQTSGGYAYRVAFSKQGDLLACGASSHLFVVDMTKNEKIAEIASASKLRPVAFSPNDDFLAAGCDDGVVRVWSVSDLRAMRPKP